MANAAQVQISNLYQGFKLAADAEGFSRAAPERRTLRDRVLVDVSADVGAASSPLKKSFFQTATENNRVRRSQEPKIVDGSGVSKDLMIGVFGVALRIDHANLAATLTEQREIFEKLSGGVLEVRIGSEVLCELSGHEVLVGDDGYLNSTDTATATVTMRSPLLKGKEPHILEWPRIMTEQSQIAADFFMDVTSWTNDNDFYLTLEILTWVARQGQPSLAGGRVAPFLR